MSQLENAPRSLIEEHQLARLQLGLSRILPHNRFYEEKILSNQIHPTLSSLDDLSNLPFTTKQELVADQELYPLFGRNLTYPLNEYIRLHQTSGTKGKGITLGSVLHRRGSAQRKWLLYDLFLEDRGASPVFRFRTFGSPATVPSSLAILSRSSSSQSRIAGSERRSTSTSTPHGAECSLK